MKKMAIETAPLRSALRALGAGNKEVSVAQLCEVFALDAGHERRDLRDLLKLLIKSGEVQRVREGVIVYNFAYVAREPVAIARLWRLVRKSKPGWTLGWASLMAGTGKRLTREYCKWLLEQGYIEVEGKQGGARTFRATAKAERSLEIPQNDAQLPHPFADEQRAALTITGLLMQADLYKADTARDIVKLCQVLMARFGSITKDENKEETPC